MSHQPPDPEGWEFPIPLADSAISDRLEPYGRFGVHLGLERIQTLLAALEHPHQRVPFIHVAGTNGKGSVCAYLSSVLTAAGYRVGRYTSPHLVSWCERITLNGRPIAPAELATVLDQVKAAIAPDREAPTQFEVITAAAWLYFAQQRVDVAVMEVGLGGRLDATNVGDRPLVAVITSLSRDHWQRLGPTLADIAREKAGILKPGCPAVVGPLPPEAEAVVTARLTALNCPMRRPEPAVALGNGMAQLGTLTYPLPLPGAHQLINSAIAVSTLEFLRYQGWAIPDTAITVGLGAARWPGRLQWLTWQAPRGECYPLLIDGAHNPAAAAVLRQYVDTILPSLSGPGPSPETNGGTRAETGTKTRAEIREEASPEARGKTQVGPAVTWLMGMLSTKDHTEVFQALLRPGDHLHLVPVPGHLSATPEELAAIATTVCPDLATCHTHPDLETGLAAAFHENSGLTVLCGSLYLVGHAFATQARRLIPAEPPLSTVRQDA
ncbi:bifunctional folylpolyglutamate synthase/dihydrofolate synthase [Leptolyngbya sp. PCC 6406]|uniref:bifunctional folylpolyglutamate synthase/dihydrofolate synthase n=1 Tax=Leptolyngbya sp. PCC 6406 TaxID=1173264 RepID=UPI0002ACBF1B|nr:folylpolyglutamate synthase/dihydrofolate synthase family protein [Leptolyngbya sp. PCC 6406]